MDREGFKFDLETQRFLVNRWETELGKKVNDKVISGLKNSVEVRAILDSYVLEHPKNLDPYGYPHYPKDAMTEGAFWVLTQDDLRGIRFYNEDFSNSPSFEKKSLSYSSFYNCNLTDANFEMSDLSYARFEKCKMDRIIFAASGGFSTKIENCSLHDACFWSSGFRDCDFSGSDFTGVYFESAILEDIKVNYLTKFDLKISSTWENRSMPDNQRPDLLRAIRIAYEKAELWSHMDRFLLEEKTNQRKHIIWTRFAQEKSIPTFMPWLSSMISGWLSGYSTKPIRVIALGIFVAMIFSGLYLIFGTPNTHKDFSSALLESIYFSFTTFATLGYGDISYGPEFPYLRILSTVEAWIGAVFIALFVAVLARKVFR